MTVETVLRRVRKRIDDADRMYHGIMLDAIFSVLSEAHCAIPSEISEAERNRLLEHTFAAVTASGKAEEPMTLEQSDAFRQTMLSVADKSIEADRRRIEATRRANAEFRQELKRRIASEKIEYVEPSVR